jgi:antitoxin (DNA-binding transcriptional repressor) of toxin-antitoxin stability system
MYHIMKTASVRELRYDFPKIERLLSEGEPVQITKRRKVIARLIPEQPKARPEMPDFMGRLRSIYGDRMHSVSGGDLIRQDRDRY